MKLWWLGLVALAACAGVLGLRRGGPAVFPHRAHVVAGVACTRCHAGLADPAPRLHLPDDATCVSCHTKPHDPRPCAGCHAAPGGVAELVEARDHLRFDHARHLGIADEGTLPASHLAHDGDWLREHGTRAASSGQLCETCHRESFCAACHGVTAPVLPARARFADPLSASVHRAGFAARHALEARSDPGACTTCHTPERCAACHTAKGLAGDPRGNPHPAGWVGLTGADNRHGREARRDPASCAGCHGGAGERLCVSCHAVGGVGGNPHPPGFSSRLPMTAMPCRMCHPLGGAAR